MSDKISSSISKRGRGRGGRGRKGGEEGREEGRGGASASPSDVGKKTRTKKGKVGGKSGAAKGRSQVVTVAVDVHRELEEEVTPPPPPPPPPVASQEDVDLDVSVDLEAGDAGTQGDVPEVEEEVQADADEEGENWSPERMHHETLIATFYEERPYFYDKRHDSYKKTVFKNSEMSRLLLELGKPWTRNYIFYLINYLILTII